MKRIIFFFFLFIHLGTVKSQITPNICLVSVDTALNENVIIWDNPNTNLIDYFKIYKEVVNPGVYDSIGVKPYDSLSYFIDTSSNPLMKPERYKISFVDTNGVESVLSNHHQTMHLTIVQGIGNSLNLFWNRYQGFQTNKYLIHRGTSINSLSVLDTVPASLYFYTDPDPPNESWCYLIEIVPPQPCIASKINTNYPYSHSNFVCTWPPPPFGYREGHMKSFDVKISPNPNNGNFIIDLKSVENSNANIYVLNTLGQKIVEFTNENINKNYRKEINLPEVQKGLYFVVIQNKEGQFVKKVVVN
jgi:hypothetical protein